MEYIECGAIIFDLDGVIVDSTAVVERYWRLWAEKHGIDSEKIMRIAHGRRTIETIRIVAPHLDAEKEAKDLALIESSDTNGLSQVDGAFNLINSLYNLDWAIVTSGIRNTAVTRLAHVGFPLPPILITADDVEHGKPNPEGFLTAANRLGIDPKNCIIVEDSPAGIEAGRAANMHAIAVTTTHSSNELERANFIVENLSSIHVSQGNYQKIKLSIDSINNY